MHFLNCRFLKIMFSILFLGLFIQFYIFSDIILVVYMSWTILSSKILNLLVY